MSSREAPSALSLKTRLSRTSFLLLALTGAAALLGVAALELGLAEQQRTALETQIQSTLTTRALSLAKSHAFVFRSLVTDTAVVEMQSTIGRTVAEESDVIYGLFLSAEGRIWAYCSPRSPCPVGGEGDLSVYDAREVLAQLQLPTDSANHLEPFVGERQVFGQPLLEVAEPVVVDGRSVGILRYGLSTSSLRNALADAHQNQSALATRALSIFGIGFLAIIAFGVYFARRTAEKITEPLSLLTSAAKRFASGEREVTVQVSSGDEVQVLGDAFNNMVSELALSYDKLETKNEELEAEIEQRKRAQNERTELQNHLIQAQKMEAFGQLAGGVAHDFNNILAVIIGNSDLTGFVLEDEHISTEELNKLNNEVRAAAERGANLTRQLLTFARRESDMPRLVDVEQTLQGFTKLIRRMLEESVELQIRTEGVASKVRIDPGRLEQVLMNLCVNARDAMPQGGKITLTTGEEEINSFLHLTSGQLTPGRYVWIRAEDTGTGIPRDILGRIFEPFFTTKEAGRGTGLGLAMVHSIVQGSGGAIEVTSTLGQGTAFTIYLPCATEDEDSAEAAQRPATQRPGHGSRILLCEDEAAVRQMTMRILEHGGYQVEHARSPHQALDLLRRTKFDLLLTDVVMPEMNGKELADQARQLVPELTVLFVSGYAGGILASQGIGDDSVYFLRKPFQARELLERVQGLLDLERATRSGSVG